MWTSLSASALARRIHRSLWQLLALLARGFHWLVWGGVTAALFFQLGGAALFEPDEGRNAEKAREILVLQDWVTPHENFHPVLDKPIFFYWLIALSYKLFGVSEWAARLPSALAALGTLIVVYRFTRSRWGEWSALWSVLVLLTSVEFFALSRVVIFDMTLAFFITVALCAFLEASQSHDPGRRRLWCALLYGALAAATLTKGLVGVVLPGIVMFSYLLLSGRWVVLKQLALIPGSLLFLVIVLSWYLPAEARNPGYLRYYFWEEHLGRFATDEFDRGEPWYYFIGVAFVGFLPWSVVLPLSAVACRYFLLQHRRDENTVFVILWAVLPFVFFSLSKSKLPHYILPIFPPLAILTAVTLARLYQERPERWRFALRSGWWVLFASAMFFLVGWFYSPASPYPIRAAVAEAGWVLWAFAGASLAMLIYMKRRRLSGPPPGQRRVYVAHAASLSVFLALITELMVLTSPSRSAQPIITRLQAKLTPSTGVVFYDTYLAGALFYLRRKEPLLLVTHETKKKTFLGNFYAVGDAATSPAASTHTILSFAEFRDYWARAKHPLLVIAKEKNLPRMSRHVGESPKQVEAVDEYVVVTQP